MSGSGGRAVLASADRDLIPLLAGLVHAQDADVADVVMAAGVDAARDVQVQLADLEQVVQVVELALDGFGHRDGDGIGQRAEVPAGTGDDVGEQTHVGGGQVQRFQLPPEFVQARAAHVGQDQVLLVRDAQFAEAMLVGQRGDRVHLVGGDVAGRHAGGLERDGDGGVAGHLVRVHVGAQPARVTLVGGGQLGRMIGLVLAAGSYCGQTKRPAIWSTKALLMVSGPPLMVCHSSSTCCAYTSGVRSLTRILMRALYLLSRRPCRL